MKKHGNTKYKFSDLINVGDIITERPNNIYSLKAAFRAYNINYAKETGNSLIVVFNEYGGKRCDIELHAIVKAKTIDNATDSALLDVLAQPKDHE